LNEKELWRKRCENIEKWRKSGGEKAGMRSRYLPPWNLKYAL
jgi:hypothetical protein